MYLTKIRGKTNTKQNNEKQLGSYPYLRHFKSLWVTFFH